MSNDPDAHVDEEPPKREVDCDIGEVKALILHALTAVRFYVEHTPHGFNSVAYEASITRAGDLADILADMLRPTPRYQAPVPDDDLPF